jgi:hypothetical protein
MTITRLLLIILIFLLRLRAVGCETMRMDREDDLIRKVYQENTKKLCEEAVANGCASWEIMNERGDIDWRWNADLSNVKAEPRGPKEDGS